MRLLMVSLAAMTASTACLGILFLYALFVPTLPAPTRVRHRRARLHVEHAGAAAHVTAAADIR